MSVRFGSNDKEESASGKWSSSPPSGNTTKGTQTWVIIVSITGVIIVIAVFMGLYINLRQTKNNYQYINNDSSKQLLEEQVQNPEDSIKCFRDIHDFSEILLNLRGEKGRQLTHNDYVVIRTQRDQYAKMLNDHKCNILNDSESGNEVTKSSSEYSKYYPGLNQIVKKVFGDEFEFDKIDISIKNNETFNQNLIFPQKYQDLFEYVSGGNKSKFCDDKKEEFESKIDKISLNRNLDERGIINNLNSIFNELEGTISMFSECEIILDPLLTKIKNLQPNNMTTSSAYHTTAISSIRG